MELPLAGCEPVVLSSCRTNVGPQRQGEGVHGLARGFLVAGARRVVASQWEVEDRSTAYLMGVFARELAKQQKEGVRLDYAEALHRAKRQMREIGRRMAAGEKLAVGETSWQEPLY